MANAHHDLALSPPRVHALRFPALDRDIDCAENETLFAAARRHGLRIVGACGGRGTCGSCMVRVQEGRVHREGKESEHSSHKKWLRACCVQPRSDLVVDVAPRSLAPVVRADVRTGGEDQVGAAQQPPPPHEGARARRPSSAVTRRSTLAGIALEVDAGTTAAGSPSLTGADFASVRATTRTVGTTRESSDVA